MTDLLIDDDFDDFAESDDDVGYEAAASPDTEFESVYEFVDDHLVLLYARHVETKPGRLWCPRWFDHAEAVSRLEALWRAYESLRLDPATGMSVWWRDHADHHMAVLMSADGPFEGCSADRGHNRPPRPLPTEQLTDRALRAAMSATDEEDTTDE
ncbi:DUF4913 domain-containing protein (plasmid) [Gordonia rubripertincta]|uniref:DUF4913 domain-containing protein n=2 Tax=Gordonia rubripertincta TaxID=36822 RepID=A0AAW6RCG5_GORRU|nr:MULTISPECIES: DUF4913 domain-containing protein [Gordonia]MDG6783119.1 DUF4913 domain-containing protein [Gordonia rubripertincta]NKY65380.1 DUF4913 domain-containing protein [Gordonia rubripertincta]GAB86872.1 hypothetical protein GORBP_083_00220 [Gordonia rubripertincta NBRC 101908]